MLYTLLISGVLFLTEPMKPVAIIEEFSGEVSVQASGTKASSALDQTNPFRYLFEKEQIVVGAKGEVRLTFFDGVKTQVLGPGTYQVAQKECVGEKGNTDAIQQIEVPAYQYASIQKGLEKLQNRGAGVIVQGFTLKANPQTPPPPRVRPFYDEVLDTSYPSFAWQSVENADRYRIEILSAADKNPIWREEVKKPAFFYSTVKPALKKNQSYTWRVDAIQSINDVEVSKRIVSSKFTISNRLPTKEWITQLQMARSNRPFNLLLCEASYTEMGWYSKSLTVCKSLVRRTPKNAEAWRLLAELHYKAGQVDEAETAYKKAIELGFQPPKTVTNEAKAGVQ